MTGYTVHTGTSKQFSAGWDRIFSDQAKSAGGAKAGKKANAKTPSATKKSAEKKPAGTAKKPSRVKAKKNK